jgi:hypothetical protein
MAKGRKTGGRVAGTPNRATAIVEERCRALIEDPEYQQYFQHRLKVGQLPAALEAMTWAYAYGKPKETVAVTGADGGAIDIHHHYSA